MTVEFKDYYRILGVDRDASDAEIKKAYRKLAGIYHPDIAKDKVAGEARFKEINEANEVLSDPDKRRKYDELGADWDRPERQASGRGGEGAGFWAGSAGDSEYRFEGTGFSDFFEQFFGSRGRASGGFGSASAGGVGDEHVARHGRDIEGDILVTLDEVLSGSARMIKMQRTDPRTRQTTTQTLQVKIPPGVREGQLIRLTGQGQEGMGGGRSGNLYLRVKFARHPDLRVQGSDLYCELELAPWDAVLGATVNLQTLDGAVSVKIPPGTPAQRQFRFRGKGLPSGEGTRGDLYATVSIQVPLSVTPEEKILWEQLARRSASNPGKTS